MDTIRKQKQRTNYIVLIGLGSSAVFLVICILLDIYVLLATIPFLISLFVAGVPATLRFEGAAQDIPRWLVVNGWVERSMDDDLSIKSVPRPPIYAVGGSNDPNYVEQRIAYYNHELDMRFILTRYYDQRNKEYFTPNFFLAFHMPERIDGWLFLSPTFGKEMEPDHSMESIEFNDKVRVWGSDKKLPFTYLPPDIMDWYLKLEEKPWIHFKNSWVSLGFEKFHMDLSLAQTLPGVAGELRQLLVRNHLMS